MLIGGGLAAGCASLPERVDAFAEAQGLERRVVAGDGFRHVVYAREADDTPRSLHVYIEGDGRPWLHGVLASADPTPRTPYALALMGRDPRPAIYLGRPCYFGLADEPGCEPRLWTDARYGPEVVASMAAALDGLLAERGWPAVMLVGYSGGGTLAVLLADRVPGVRRVVTVAGNLDTDAWTAAHGYRPLAGSLNPMTAARLAGVEHLHFAGAADANVSPGIARAFAERHGGRVQVVEGFDHRCCWRERWPGLLLPAASSPTIHSDATRRGEQDR
ncbi:hypothetical protein PC39_07589 [Salinisphaera sp. PC39]|uniref:alpha/beta fold hydrolase n=1 Tax=Salinisphaera sp. PC39 TaxID=1304156 RepID=UPI0033426229